MNCNFEGDYIVTYTATDIAGNTASCSKTFQFPNTNPLDASDIVWLGGYSGCRMFSGCSR
jgi:hypothetical protein